MLPPRSHLTDRQELGQLSPVSPPRASSETTAHPRPTLRSSHEVAAQPSKFCWTSCPRASGIKAQQQLVPPTLPHHKARHSPTTGRPNDRSWPKLSAPLIFTWGTLLWQRPLDLGVIEPTEEVDVHGAHFYYEHPHAQALLRHHTWRFTGRTQWITT